MSTRAQKLAERIERGGAERIAFAETLSKAEWQTAVGGDGRPAGVVIHHVASAYVIEASLVQGLATGKAMQDITVEIVNWGNAQHAAQNLDPDLTETLDLLRRNAAQAAETVRGLSDEHLDWAAPNSLHANTPLTIQYFIEQHPIGHSYHHMAKIRATLEAQTAP